MLEGADVVYKKVSGNCTDFAKGHKKAASKLKRLFLWTMRDFSYPKLKGPCTHQKLIRF